MKLTLSPTKLRLIESDPEAAYRLYILGWKEKQTVPMAVGSAFDVAVKRRIRSDFGMEEVSGEFERAVEEQNRGTVQIYGDWCLEKYKEGYLDLMLQLKRSVALPKLESRIQREVEGVMLDGIPDLFFYSPAARECIHDWKVNGYMSKGSPKKYHMTWEGRGEYKGLVTKEVEWEGLVLGQVNGRLVEMQGVDAEWADQLTIYAWIMGSPIGRTIAASIDQLCCDGGPPCPNIRVFRYRGVVTEEYQMKLWERVKGVWEKVKRANSGETWALLGEDKEKAAYLDGLKDDPLRDIMI